MVEDQQLQDAIASLGEGGGRLVLYLTYQPCHHSGGRVSKGAILHPSAAALAAWHPATCSEHLKKYFLTELKPRGVQLELVLADVYKARAPPPIYELATAPAHAARTRNAREH